MIEENLKLKIGRRVMSQWVDQEEGADPDHRRDTDHGHPCQDMMIYIEEMTHMEGLYQT